MSKRRMLGNTLAATLVLYCTYLVLVEKPHWGIYEKSFWVFFFIIWSIYLVVITIKGIRDAIQRKRD